MRTRAAPLPVVVACLLLSACERVPTAPVIPERPAPIRYGVPTGAAHPEVVLVVMDVAGVPTYRCSGTLIAPKVVLTAGHCTGAPGEFSALRIFTESNVDGGDNNYPYAGPNSIPARAWHTHPLYTDAAFFLHDVGVIELRSPVALAASQYGVLPTRDQLDALHTGPATRFTAVGYGVQRITGAFTESERIRMSAEPYLLQINTGLTGSFSLLLSNNASSGGTCFGDSGGPNFLGTSRVVAGVTSFAMNSTCGGTGGVFRMDRADVLAFVSRYL